MVVVIENVEGVKNDGRQVEVDRIIIGGGGVGIGIGGKGVLLRDIDDDIFLLLRILIHRNPHLLGIRLLALKEIGIVRNLNIGI